MKPPRVSTQTGSFESGEMEDGASVDRAPTGAPGGTFILRSGHVQGMASREEVTDRVPSAA